MAKKKDDFRVYLRGDLEFPAQLDVKEDGVQVGTMFFNWKQLTVFIKMLQAAKAFGKQGDF